MRAISSVLAFTACTLLLATSSVAASAERKGWPPETLTGKITMVDPIQRLVVVQTPDGVPYDMVVTPRTRIDSGDQALTLNDLSRDMNKNVSVRYVPEGRGDVARSIQING